jgi:hypothetical protein
MARTTLPAATVSIAGGPNSGTILPAAEPTSLATFTGLNFANNGAVLLRVVVGAAGAGNLTVNFTRTTEGQLPAAFVTALANSNTYIFGPFSPSDLNDGNGLVQIDMSVVTGNTAGLYTLPTART